MLSALLRQWRQKPRQTRLRSAPEATFVCGANAFVGTVAYLLIDAGTPRETIRTERYGGS